MLVALQSRVGKIQAPIQSVEPECIVSSGYNQVEYLLCRLVETFRAPHRGTVTPRNHLLALPIRLQTDYGLR